MQRSFENIFDGVKSTRNSAIFAEFESSYLPCLKEATKTFWESEFEFKLFDVSKFETIKSDSFLSGDIFFTSQVSALNTPPVTLRLDDTFSRLVLHNTFGSNSNQFKLMDLSELEIRILNSYCDFLYKSFSKLLIPPEELTKPQIKNKELFNFVVLVKDFENKISKLVITLPQSRFKVADFQCEQNFEEDYFKNVPTLVDIEAGSSKITLNELKTITSGDIILLENSVISKMKIRTYKEFREFKINPDPSLIVELDEDEHDIDSTEGALINMWDDIQIEVDAQFNKVKMTLGELKQISKGLVIDLGSVFENEISLLVENKVVAKGELVIIGDKYAVKVLDVIKEQQAPRQQAPQVAQQAPKQAPQPAPRDEVEEDFDYSDFEEGK